MNVLTDRLSATFALMTSLPVAQAETRVQDASPALFPVVGLALGVLLLALDAMLGQLLPRPATSALVVLALAVFTGALHLDGLADSADGLFGGRDQSSRLAIMDDPRNGAFGFVAVALALLLKFSAIVSLSGWLRAGTLLLFPFAARTAVLWLMALLPAARQSGMANQAAAVAVPVAALTTAAGLAVASVVFFPAGGLLIVGALMSAAAIGLYALRRLGGVTGDVLGASIEIAEVAVVLLAATSVEEEWLT
ncbi:MAG TPA: adenosylcobinamide-GDP ribazoletransferase [Dehalococcoidia bacterium]|nr:adenosylcobinamide-GDP ribazoletransferase [Dehalococcoidia bacterium]